MALHKKLVGQDAAVFKSWINQSGNTIIDLDGQKYVVRPVQNEIQEDLESDTELREMILHSKTDIANGEVYSTQEVIKKIERGEV